MRSIDFLDIPKYSDWPAILLGLKGFSQKKKTPSEVMREFDLEKWSSVLSMLESDVSMRASDIDSSRLGKIEIPIMDSGRFYLTSGLEALQAQLDHQIRVMARWGQNASALAELGAGYGSILFRLARTQEFRRHRFFAAEYTRSGQAAIDILAPREGLAIPTGYCDFREMRSEGAMPPLDSIIYTSYAVHYVDELSADFTGFFASMKPSVVVHFEPCYEHCDSTTVYGMMCKRYIEINDYNRNLASVLWRSRDRGTIEILLEEKQVVGANPFLPMSIFVWRPK